MTLPSREEQLRHRRERPARVAAARESRLARLRSVPPIQLIYTPNELTSGARCPCCGRWVKVNYKDLNKTMLQYLKLLYQARLINHGWIEASRLRVNAKLKPGQTKPGKYQSGDYKTLAVWDLSEKHPDENLWRITQQGIDFMEGRIRVEQGIIQENNKSRFLGFLPGRVNVYDVEGTSFNVADL